MTTHEQVVVEGISVDVRLAELLTAVWRTGIQTAFSCQGGPGEAMILFPTVADAVNFMAETLDRTGFYGCYSARLVMTMADPLPCIPGWGSTQYSDPEARIRAKVEWPHEFTQVWTAAWCGEPFALDDVLDLIREMESAPPKKGERGWVATTPEDVAEVWADARRVVKEEQAQRRLRNRHLSDGVR